MLEEQHVMFEGPMVDSLSHIGRHPVSLDRNMLEPSLVPKAGLFPKLKRKDKVTNGRR